MKELSDQKRIALQAIVERTSRWIERNCKANTRLVRSDLMKRLKPMCAAKLMVDVKECLDAAVLNAAVLDAAVPEARDLSIAPQQQSGQQPGIKFAQLNQADADALLLKIKGWIARRTKAGNLPKSYEGLERALRPLCVVKSNVEPETLLNALSQQVEEFHLLDGDFVVVGKCADADSEPVQPLSPQCSVVVPSEQVGELVGKQGKTIKKLRQQLGVQLKMVKSKHEGTIKHTVTISICKHKFAGLSTIDAQQKIDRAAEVFRQDVLRATLTIELSPLAVGRLIGKRGQSLAKLLKFFAAKGLLGVKVSATKVSASARASIVLSVPKRRAVALPRVREAMLQFMQEQEADRSKKTAQHHLNLQSRRKTKAARCAARGKGAALCGNPESEYLFAKSRWAKNGKHGRKHGKGSNHGKSHNLKALASHVREALPGAPQWGGLSKQEEWKLENARIKASKLQRRNKTRTVTRQGKHKTRSSTARKAGCKGKRGCLREVAEYENEFTPHVEYECQHSAWLAVRRRPRHGHDRSLARAPAPSIARSAEAVQRRMRRHARSHAELVNKLLQPESEPQDSSSEGSEEGTTATPTSTATATLTATLTATTTTPTPTGLEDLTAAACMRALERVASSLQLLRERGHLPSSAAALATAMRLACRVTVPVSFAAVLSLLKRSKALALEEQEQEEEASRDLEKCPEGKEGQEGKAAKEYPAKEYRVRLNLELAVTALAQVNESSLPCRDTIVKWGRRELDRGESGTDSASILSKFLALLQQACENAKMQVEPTALLTIDEWGALLRNSTKGAVACSSKDIKDIVRQKEWNSSTGKTGVHTEAAAPASCA